MTGGVEPAGLAGSWYPADAGELRDSVAGFVGTAAPDPGVTAAVVPHAGHRYSGRAAGAAYRRLAPARWARAVVVAPSHRRAFRGGAVHPASGFATPLGTVEADRETAGRLAACPGVALDPRPFRGEHAVEIQLPFLRVVAPGLPVVALLVGTTELAALVLVAAALREIDDGATLFLVSSDFTHYGAAFDYVPFPPDGAEPVRRRLAELDAGAIEAVCRGDADGFRDYVEATGATVCGWGPIEALLRARGEALAGELVSYYTSLDVTGDHEHSVSYASIVLRPRGAA